MAHNNPWRGLASYKDPLTSKQEYRFCGRDTETSNLVKLIDNNLFVTLYGRTGVGKTSLLNAGVFPILRQRGYFPIYIRLAQESTGITYAKAIINKIKASGLKECCSMRFNENDKQSKTYLWNYFCTTTFQNNDGHKVYPVIVLDQFEEIFYSQKEKAELLLQQIYALLNDDLALPDEENYSDETNYRFVASIREDNLFYLEDSIDEQSLNLYKENRYRLRPLKPVNAKAAILEPGLDCIDKESKEEIADKIINISKDKDGTISSLILSLICSLMYEKASKTKSDSPIIELQHIPNTQEDTDKILSDFYLSNTTKKQRKIIEKYLLTDDGHRKAANIEISKCKNLLSEGNRILQKVETDAGEMVEIVHDRMAKVIYMQRRRRDNNRFRNLLRILLLILLLVAFSTAIKMSWTSTTKNYLGFALYTPKYTPIKKNTPLILDEDTVKRIYINKYDTTKVISIKDNVSNIDSLYISKDNVDVIVSPNNKHIGWDYIHYDGHLIKYLYHKNNPENAIYIQKKISNEKSIRLPKAINKLYYHSSAYKTTDRLPAYGEKIIEIDTLEEEFYRNDLEIETIKFKNIKDIPSYAFAGCENLTNVNFDGIERIRVGAFEYSNLREIDLSQNKEVHFHLNAFANCMNLKKIKLPKKLTGNLRDVFAYCLNLREVDLPDEIEDTDDLSFMFKFCTNIQSLKIHSNSHFRLNPNDSIVYYDSIPVIFNKCRLTEWSLDSTYIYKNGIFQAAHGSSYITYRPTFISEKWNLYHGTYYCADYNYHRDIIIKKSVDSILYLPAISHIKSNKKFNLYCIGDFRQINEIHTRIATPNYMIKFNDCDITNEKDITLYVPYGCKEAYDKDEQFKEFKEIKEESLNCRIASTIEYYLRGIVGFFKAYTILLYSLIIIGLCVLFFWFYWLKMKQLKNQGIQNHKPAILAGLLGIPVAIISFIPVYYLIFIYLTNYTEMTFIWNTPLSSIGGVISSCLCSYIFVFSGKGKIWKSFRRMTDRETK